MEFDPHPLLDATALHVRFPASLGSLPTLANLNAWLSLDAPAPLTRSDEVKSAVRNLLRHGGFKPTGRNKPASEYLIKAVDGGFLGPINPAVDVCNVVSLHSGLPISVVDPTRGKAPWRVGIAAAGSRYVFNAAGQEIDISGLLSLFDADGPCGGPVKDSQRTKTTDETTTVIYILWGTTDLPERTAIAAAWLTELVEALDGTVTPTAQAGRLG